MSNSYYNHTTYPTPNSPGSSSTLRLELDAITTGFSLLPTLAANGYKVAMVNWRHDPQHRRVHHRQRDDIHRRAHGQRIDGHGLADSPDDRWHQL